MKIKTKVLFLATILIVAALAICISAQPLMPHQFYGTATYNGASSEGIKVDAYIEDSIIDTVFTQSGGFYSLKVGDSGEYIGKTITFYLNDMSTGQTGTFENGASTELDLSATGTTPPPANTGGSGGGGSSGRGSSGSGSSTTTSTSTSTTTTSSNENKEETGPETDSLQDQDPEKTSGITGAFAGVFDSASGIGVFIFIVAIIALAIFVFVMRKRENK